MPAPIIGIIGAVLGQLAAWLIVKGLRGLIAALIGMVFYKTNLGYSLIQFFLQNSDWDPEKLNMPDWASEWTEYVCAVNAWIPVAESWVLGKIYLSLLLSSIAVRWMGKIRS